MHEQTQGDLVQRLMCMKEEHNLQLHGLLRNSFAIGSPKLATGFLVWTSQIHRA